PRTIDPAVGRPATQAAVGLALQLAAVSADQDGSGGQSLARRGGGQRGHGLQTPRQAAQPIAREYVRGREPPALPASARPPPRLPQRRQPRRSLATGTRNDPCPQ